MDTEVPPSEVAIVAIDSRTGGQLDLPPLPRDWPRSIHGRLVDELMRRGAEVIVFDVHFGRAKDPESDGVFVDAVQRSGRVLLVELLTGKRQPISDQSGRHVGMVWTEESVPPFEGLADAGNALIVAEGGLIADTPSRAAAAPDAPHGTLLEGGRS